MPQFTVLDWNYFFVGLCSLLISCFFIKKYAPKQLVLPIALIKIAIPFVYFLFFYNKFWSFVDDIWYMEVTKIYLSSHFNPISIFTDEAARFSAFATINGPQIAWPWTNFLLQYFLGNNYYVMIFFNVTLTSVNGYFLYRILKKIGFPDQYATLAALFSIIHWDILTWSSLLNMKGTLVIFSTMIMILTLYKIEDNKSSPWFYFLFAIETGLMFFLRAYVPICLAAAFFLYGYLHFSKKFKIAITILSILCLFVILSRIKAYIGMVSPSRFPAGIFKILLTPKPTSIRYKYEFLYMASYMHWIMFAPMCLAMIDLWRRNQRARLLIIFIVGMFFLYAVGPSKLQGPRQRYQLAPYLAWFHFHFFWVMYERIKNSEIFKRKRVLNT